MIGQTLHNRYTITARVGSGAMGTVYRATDLQTEKEVAVKVIARELAFDLEMLERFRREGEALQQLRHPNIVGFVETFQQEGQQVIVMEYIPGGSLHDLIKQGPLPIDRARRIALELCDALTRAHYLDIIHRDIKPENVLIAEDGTPKLTDFGVARLVSEATRLTGTGMQVGTPYYMSPEAWEGKPLDAQADIWSLGVVLFEILTGAVPFGGDTAAAVMTKVLMTPPPDLRQLRAELPEGWAAMVGRMLARDRAARYLTMRQVAADLERGTPTAVPIRPAVQLARPTRRIPAWALGTAAIVAVGIAIGSLWASGTLARLGGQPAATTAIDLSGAATLERTATVSVRQTQNAIRMATDSARATTEPLAPSSTPVPTNTLSPIEKGERIDQCGDDVCAIGYAGGSTALGLAGKYTSFHGASWSPDGTHIVFSACPLDLIGACHEDLFIVSRNSGDVKPLVKNPATNELTPAWSPDGNWIAYHGEGALRLVRADGTETRTLAVGANSRCPASIAWAPGSQRLAWIGGICGETGIAADYVWVADVDGDYVRSIFHSDTMGLGSGSQGQIAWSPDGTSVAVMTQIGSVYLIDADCPSRSGGCDESSRTVMESMPEHWLHTFYPQWAGEDVSR